MATDDPFIAELLELAKRNMRAGPVSALPMIVSAGGWASLDPDRIPPNGMLVIPDGADLPPAVRDYLSDCPTFAGLDLGLWQ